MLQSFGNIPQGPTPHPSALCNWSFVELGLTSFPSFCLAEKTPTERETNALCFGRPQYALFFPLPLFCVQCRDRFSPEISNSLDVFRLVPILCSSRPFRPRFFFPSGQCSAFDLVFVEFFPHSAFVTLTDSYTPRLNSDFRPPHDLPAGLKFEIVLRSLTWDD